MLEKTLNELDGLRETEYTYDTVLKILPHSVRAMVDKKSISLSVFSKEALKEMEVATSFVKNLAKKVGALNARVHIHPDGSGMAVIQMESEPIPDSWMSTADSGGWTKHETITKTFANYLEVLDG